MRRPTFWRRFWCVIFGGHADVVLLLRGNRPVIVECRACSYRRGSAS